MARNNGYLLGLVLLVIGLFVWLSLFPDGAKSTDALVQTTENKSGTNSVEVTGPTIALERILGTSDREEAVALAQERKEQMLQWMVSDPERALAEAVTLAEYDSLPEDLQVHFEQPFHERGDLLVLPVCQGTGFVPEEPSRIVQLGQSRFEANVLGSRKQAGTKENTPLSGIALQGRAVVSGDYLAMVQPGEEGRFGGWALANPMADRSFSSGDLLGESPVTAIAGGKRFLFGSEAELDSFNEQLAELDLAPGPHSGAQVVFELADGDGAEGFDWEAAGELVANEASTWTETPKSVLFIRVDFSDVPGASVSQSLLEGILNTEVSDNIDEMSYGKTSINGTVTSALVRLPKPTTDYLPNNNSLLRDDAIAAYTSAPYNGSVAGYDIIGVHFASIGMQGSSGTTYAGLAGGSRQWLQGTTSSEVIVHEFGHNYGLGHASFWATSDGSVAGAGSSVEYGDPFDIMGSGPDPEGHFHLQGKSRLNWLENSQWADATSLGSDLYRIYPFDNEATTGTNRGVRVTKASSPAEYYWIGYRVGFEGNPWLKEGGYLLWQRPGSSRSWLLDTTPGSVGGSEDAALVIGATYSDVSADVHLTPIAKGGVGADAWLDVNVQLGPFPGNLAPTAVANIASSASARENVALSVTGSDADGDDLAYFWDFGDGSTSTNASTVSHSWSTGGTYTVTVTVSDMKGGSVTKSAVVMVSDPLDNWTEEAIVASRSMRDIAYLNGRYLVGSNGYISLSLDGVNWSDSNIALNYRSEGFAVGEGRFVAVGFDWNGSAWVGTLHYSNDGRSWQSANPPGGG